MARYDKYEPKGGGFRAPLAEDMTAGQVDTILGVGLDVNGHLVIGAGDTGVVGVMCMPRLLKAGEIADVMTSGDITEVSELDPGTLYYAAAADGVVSTTNTGTHVGHTVGDRNGVRLVVRVQLPPAV